MKFVHLLFSTDKIRVILAFFTGLLTGASNAGIIALINIAIANPQYSKIILGISFVGFCLLLLVSMTASQILLGRLVQGVTYNLKLQLNRRILACPLHQIEQIGGSRLLATLTDDVEAISAASAMFANLCVAIAMVVACVVYLCWLSLPIFTLILGSLLLGIISTNLLLNQARHFFKLARVEQDKLFSPFRTTIEGIKELKLDSQRRQAFISDDLEVSANNYRKHRVKAVDVLAIAGSWGVVALFIPIGLLVFILPSLFNLSTSVLSGYALAIVFMLTPLRIILNTLPEVARANIALEKIESLGLSLAAVTIEPEIQVYPNQKSFKSCLEFFGVTHSYFNERDGSHFTLGPINLSFAPGELVFIIGGNGSGKSTLVKLITGLYIPADGAVLLDGEAITDKNRDWYRQQFSVVFSDFYLFERLLGFNDAGLDVQAQDYLVKLQLDHKVQIKNGVLSSTSLSQGQRKRLALLTAYLEDRPIYVFDEWASDQDPVFKEVFYTQLLPELKKRGKTVLAISHDDHYFYVADRIVKLDYGQVEYDKVL